MTTNKRFVALDTDEVYYITDTENLRTLDDFIKIFSDPEYEYDEEEVLSVAKEKYWEMIYENSMSAKENVDMLNNLFNENEQLKLEINMLKTTIARNEAHIKRLTQTSEWGTSAYD